MKFCPVCGQPLDPITNTCPICGGHMTQDFSDSFINAIKNKLRSPLMLIFCILSTASALLTMFGDENLIAGLLNLLIPIGIWITYFSACSAKQTMGLAGIKIVSVVITVMRIFIWIIVGLVIVFAILLFAVPSAFNEIILNLSFMAEEYAYMADSIYELGSALTIVIAIALCFAAVIIILFNIFFYGSVSKSIKSVIESFNTRTNRLRKLSAVKVWLMVLGTFAVIGTVSEFSLVSIIDTATLFVGAILAGKIGNTTHTEELM